MSTSKKKYINLRPLSSLAKVFPEKIYGKTCREIKAITGQEVSFQIAYRLANEGKYKLDDLKIDVSSPFSEVTLYNVGTVPSELPVYPDRIDKNYLTTKSGIFPDPLFPIANSTVSAARYNWRSVWVTVNIPEDQPAGDYTIAFRFTNEGGESASVSFKLQVQALTLPKQELYFTQWFHCDCIADVHKVEIFSEEHWALIRSYMQLAAKHGMNTILTPVTTPPLDTAIGGERPTVQLVEITRANGRYSFNCDLLKRFIALALDCGIENFEISHLFTQWGAKYAPKVMARTENGYEKIFGWETDALGDPAYAEFLKQFVPVIMNTFDECGISRSRLLFHVSDEPRIDDLENYKKARNILIPLTEGCKHIDALSNLEFYTEGLVKSPVVATNHINAYLDAKVENLWCYYCCSQCVDVANRFFSMPSSRNRIIGVQLYKYNIEGFLQWGYNFYYTHHSLRLIDPYTVTDCDRAFPSGDPFTVYPYKDGAIPSLRQKVFASALDDLKLLKLVEKKIGRADTVALIEKAAKMTVTFSEYPTDDEFFDRLYEEIFEALNK